VRFPARDVHFADMVDAAKHYQRLIYDEALKRTTGRRYAVDLGAHCGIFTCRMEEDFENVVAFEPAADNFRCLVENTTKARLLNVCVWHEPAMLEMVLQDHNNSGANEVDKSKRGAFPAMPLDALGLDCVDLIKLDIQGCELEALRGAARTLESNPVLIVEHTDWTVYHYLVGIGYKPQAQFSRDAVWTR